jgi:hypothetical protein
MTARFSFALCAPLVLAACIENRAPADNDDGRSAVVAKDAGQDAGGDAGEPDGGGSPLAGTGLACTGYQDAPPGKCWGYWCGISYEDVRAATVPSGICQSDAELQLICEGGIARKVAQCGRDNAIFFNDFEERIDACVRKVATYDPISDACLDCYTASARCALMHCASECVDGDSPDCDKCRMDNDCTPDWYTCSGVPTVF